MQVMNDYLVKKIATPHEIFAQVPGSKSISNRALLIAALAEGTSVIRGLLFSDDSRYFLKVLESLGFPVEIDEENCTVTITGFGGQIPRKEASVYVGSAGTAARFLTALLGMSDGKWQMNSSEQMKKRPMQELLEALQLLGAEISFGEKEWHFPYTIGNHRGLLNEEVTVDVDKSSQFLSALLISSVLFDHDFHIHVTGSHGMAYVEMTIHMMEQFGVRVVRLGEKEFLIPGASAYKPLDYQVEPDISAACYFYAMSPVLNVPSTVANVRWNSMQGDIQFLKVLEDMGCRLEEKEKGIRILPPVDGIMKGGCWNLASFSDQTLTLAAIAPFCDSPVLIQNVGHIQYQECDRLSAIQENLKAMGIKCQEKEGNLTILPGTPKPAFLNTYDDHRVAMAFSIPGLVIGDMVIENYRCCKKTFAEYFEKMEEYCC